MKNVLMEVLQFLFYCGLIFAGYLIYPVANPDTGNSFTSIDSLDISGNGVDVHVSGFSSFIDNDFIDNIARTIERNQH